MDRTVKEVVAVILCAIIMGVTIYGSFLPLRKAQMFIGTLQSFQQTPPNSLDDLESRLSVPLDYPGPIGQEELVRNTANSILGLLQRGLDASTTAELVGYLNTYYDPIISRGRGMSFGQDLYLNGAVNEVAFASTNNAGYLNDALRNYQKGADLGPNRPQVLYGLFDVYRAMGDVVNTEMIAKKILSNWPGDQNVPGALAQFLATQTKATSTSKKGK